MGRKGKRAAQAKKTEPDASASPPPTSSAPAVEPVAAGVMEWLWFAGATLVVCGVGLWFQLNVNRVFDVPKAVVLKVGGCSLFVVWLLYALFGPGVRWRSARVFAGPVTAMTLVVIVSTFLSIDFSTSFNGVYERQFGLQGFLACVGLFFLTATGLSGKRGAWVGIAVLAVVGSTMGVYSFYQANGWDPWPFFWNRPFDKVYSFLGNATFAGNALALILPMIAVAGGVATSVTLAAPQRRDRLPVTSVLWLVGLAGALFIQIVPPRIQALDALALDPTPRMPPDSLRTVFKLCMGVPPIMLLTGGLLGTWGPPSTRLGQQRDRFAADAFAAGVLVAMVVGIGMGLIFTRTRGAWVGTAVAIAAGFILLPRLAHGTRWLRPAQAACWGTAAAVAVAFTVYITMPTAVCGPKDDSKCWLYVQTIHSIPKGFDTSTFQGKGQGTRPFLWSESPRVLFNHSQTLKRAYDDREDYADHVDQGLAKMLNVEHVKPYGETFRGLDSAWRSVGVWLFGIGVETYRYAFMSHKSMRLERLDPMTNHDNPHNNYLYVLASFGVLGLIAYVWLLWSLLSTAFRRFMQSSEVSSRVDRAMAFGVVTSFFSYAVYSIAGFDSVACSVFLFFLLGTAAAMFNPNLEEQPQNLVTQVRRQWAEFRGRDPATVPAVVPAPVLLAVALVTVPLLLVSAYRATVVYRAERALTGDPVPVRTRLALYEGKAARAAKAVQTNPTESFYKQSLGNAYADLSREYTRQANAQGLGRPEAMRRLKKAAEYHKLAEGVLYAALDHAWAPENIYISLFQLYYRQRDFAKAERALERALVHSPHLGAVRVNLAMLQFRRKAFDEAFANADWVTEVDPPNALGWRIRGQIHKMRGHLKQAKADLRLAVSNSRSKDATAKKLLEEVEAQLAAEEAKTTSTAAATSG